MCACHTELTLLRGAVNAAATFLLVDGSSPSDSELATAAARPLPLSHAGAAASVEDTARACFPQHQCGQRMRSVRKYRFLS